MGLRPGAQDLPGIRGVEHLLPIEAHLFRARLMMALNWRCSKSAPLCDRFEMGPSEERQCDFFVSYTKADKAWAVWIAWIVEEMGFRAMVQDWDFRPGTNWGP